MKHHALRATLVPRATCHFQNRMTELVYRYANAETFLTMLSSQELWFSDLRKMNDSDEYAAGFRIVSEIITSEYPEEIEILNEISPDKMNTRFMVLICSFSSAGDCLSMWRGYGANGRGAAIGYDSRDIKNHSLFVRYLNKMNPVSGNVAFFPVIYDEEIYRTSLRQQIQRILSQPKNLSAEEADTFAAIRTGMLGFFLTRMCVLYKNEFFADEREIRGFIEINDKVDPHELKTRPSDFGETAYHPLNTNFSGVPAIKEVILGPRCTLTPEKIRDKLIENGLMKVAIRSSIGTYR